MLPQPLLERGEDVGAPRQGCKRPCLFPARGDRAPADPTSTAHPPLRVPSPASAHRSTATRRGTSTPSSLRRAAGSPRSGSGCPLAASWATAGSGRTDRHPASSTHRPPRRCATRRTLSAAFGAAPADLTPTSFKPAPGRAYTTPRRGAPLRRTPFSRRSRRAQACAPRSRDQSPSHRAAPAHDDVLLPWRRLLETLGTQREHVLFLGEFVRPKTTLRRATKAEAEAPRRCLRPKRPTFYQQQRAGDERRRPAAALALGARRAGVGGRRGRGGGGRVGRGRPAARQGLRRPGAQSPAPARPTEVCVRAGPPLPNTCGTTYMLRMLSIPEMHCKERDATTIPHYLSRQPPNSLPPPACPLLAPCPPVRLCHIMRWCEKGILVKGFIEVSRDGLHAWVLGAYALLACCTLVSPILGLCVDAKLCLLPFARSLLIRVH